MAESQLQTLAGKVELEVLLHLEALMRASHSIKGAARIVQQKERECREILNDRVNEIEQFAYRSFNLSERLYREQILVIDDSITVREMERKILQFKIIPNLTKSSFHDDTFVKAVLDLIGK